MSKVERFKDKARRFLGEQYREYAPKEVKGVARKLRSREPWVKETFQSRSAKGKAQVKEIISKQTGRLPIPNLRRKRRKKR